MGFGVPALRPSRRNELFRKILSIQGYTSYDWDDDYMNFDHLELSEKSPFRTGNPYLTGGDMISRLFHYEIGTRLLPNIYREVWSSDKVDSFPLEGDVDGTKELFTTTSPSSCGKLVEIDGNLVLFQAWYGKVSVNIGTHDLKDATRIVEVFKKLFPPTSALNDDECIFYFWHKGGYGANSNRKTLKVVRWVDVDTNYTTHTHEKLDHLMKLPPLPETSPRLLLWHGAAGTGKTFSIRALARQWKAWCQFEYIIDPEVMLDNASYMTDIIHGDYSEDEGHPEDEDIPARRVPNDKKWRVIVMEDTSEVLGIDARQRSGQGLSRLLNLADGILGQGTRILFLITTNEPLGKIHPAVKRPGRCLSQIEFRPFDRYQARDWLKKRGKEVPPMLEPRNEISLAEMYAVVNGQEFDPNPQTEKAGFIR